MTKVIFFAVFVGAIVSDNLARAQNCNGAPPLHINPQSCCNHPKIVDDQIFMQCFSDFRQQRTQRQTGQYSHQGPHSPQSCIGECVFKTVQLWNGQDIDLVAAQRYLTRDLSSTPEWIPIVTEGFAKCSNEAKSIAKLFGTSNGGECSPVPALTLACLHSHVIANCPANLWNNSNQCDELKRFFVNCPLPPKH